MNTLITAILGAVLAALPALAVQDPAMDKERPKQHEVKSQAPSYQPQEPQPPDKPKPSQPPEKPKPEPAPAPPKPQPKPQEKPQQQEKGKEQPPADNEKNAKKSQKRSGQQSATMTQGKAKGQRIPPEKFQAKFGPEHHFRVHQLQDGRRFTYGGYWFELVEVWPADWFYDDECYIEQDGNDYYLLDAYHPGTRVLVIVVEG